jgi:hypothetical protein
MIGPRRVLARLSVTVGDENPAGSRLALARSSRPRPVLRDEWGPRRHSDPRP